jgi:hypothetical protein
MTIDHRFHETSKEIGNQVQIDHKRARFLRLYFQTSKKYNGFNWYWNAGQYPVEKTINRCLVLGMNREFGLLWDRMFEILYLENINDWREKYFTVHLIMRGNRIEGLKNWCFDKNRIPSILHFNEKNVMTLETFVVLIKKVCLTRTFCMV